MLIQFFIHNNTIIGYFPQEVNLIDFDRVFKLYLNLTLTGLTAIFLIMVKVKIGKKMKKIWGLPGFLLLAFLLGACGYPSPTPGGGLTPFVVVVTPTPLSSTITAAAQANASPTPTSSATVRPTVAATPSPAATSDAVKPTPSLAVSADNKYTVQAGDTLFGIAIR